MDAHKQVYMCVQTIIIMCGCMHAHVPCVVCFVCVCVCLFVGVTVCLHSSVHADVLILNRIAPCQHNRSRPSGVKSLLQRERGENCLLQAGGMMKSNDRETGKIN